MQASIRSEGLDQLIRTLDADVLQEADPAIKRGTVKVEGRMKRYPPQRSRSNYRRTGLLGRSWTHQFSRGARTLRGEVGTNTVYAAEVQSHLLQARVHRGRWQTDLQVLEQEGPGIAQDIEDTLIRTLGRR